MLFCLNVFGGKSSTNSCLRLYSLLIEVHCLAKSPYVASGSERKESNPRGENEDANQFCIIGDFLVCILYPFSMPYGPMLLGGFAFIGLFGGQI